MENRTIKKSFKINYNKSIGTVIFVVEGEKDEFDFLYKVFHKFLHYDIVMKRRQNKIKEHNTYTSQANKNNGRVVVINANNSNILNLKQHEDFRNEIYKELVKEYNIDPKNSPIYYIWDRDNRSNDKTITRNLVFGLNSAYENKFFENGLLLLSYPAFESYKLTCSKRYKQKTIQSVKSVKKIFQCKIQPVSKEKISLAAQRMTQALKCLNIDFDCWHKDIGRINIEAFKKEEAHYKKNSGYLVLSLISLALLDLGIIEEI